MHWQAGIPISPTKYHERIRVSESNEIAQFVNSFAQLNEFCIWAFDFKLLKYITTPIKKLEGYIQYDLLDKFNTETLETLCLRYGEDIYYRPIKLEPRSPGLTQRLGQYSFPNLHTITFEWDPDWRVDRHSSWGINMKHLANMRSLVNCNFYNCKVSNLKPKRFPNLQTLLVGTKQFFTSDDFEIDTFKNTVSLNNLPSFSSFTSLTLNFCGLQSVAWLRKLDRLEALDLNSNNLKDLGFLTHLKSLKKFTAMSKNIEAIPDLLGLNCLVELNLLENKIKEFSGLLSLKNLRTLNLSSNWSLRTLKGGFALCRRLRTLELNYCAIEKLEGLKNLTQLEFLDVSNNQLTTLGNLNGQKGSLVILRASKNRVSKIEQDFSQFTALAELSLGKNEIHSFKNIHKLHAIQKLDLGDNKLAQVDQELEYPQLQVLVLSGNTVSPGEFEKSVQINKIRILTHADYH